MRVAAIYARRLEQGLRLGEYAKLGVPVALEAARNGKHIVLMNAELDATPGPILNVYAQKAGIIMSACDGDEPGLQMNLVRWVQGLGLTRA